METWYKFLVRHNIAVTRILYIAPLVAFFTQNRAILYFTILLCLAISATYPIGAVAKWEGQTVNIKDFCLNCKHLYRKSNQYPCKGCMDAGIHKSTGKPIFFKKRV